MNFQNAIKYGFSNYANFSGVVDRATYWWWFLFTALVGIVLQIMSGISQVLVKMFGTNAIGIFDGLVSLLVSAVAFALAIPSLALAVRRFRDVGINPWILVFGLIPLGIIFAGALVGGVLGASLNTGYESFGSGFAGALVGMLPGIFVALGWQTFLIIMLCRPTKTRAQGNKYAVA